MQLCKRRQSNKHRKASNNQPVSTCTIPENLQGLLDRRVHKLCGSCRSRIVFTSWNATRYRLVVLPLICVGHVAAKRLSCVLEQQHATMFTTRNNANLRTTYVDLRV